LTVELKYDISPFKLVVTEGKLTIN